VPSLRRPGERPTATPVAEPAAESDDADLELLESHGTWTLRLAHPFTELSAGTTLRIRISPNLVPGVPFHAEVIFTDADAPNTDR
jgi:hypothetical protein